MNTPKPRTWLCEPLMWLVVGLPLATVVAGIATLAIALDAPDPSIADAVRRQAQIQELDLAADRAALDAELVAELRASRTSGAIEVVMARGAAPAELRLALRHTADAARDITLTLQRDAAGRYLGQSMALTTAAWNLELRAPDAAWLIVGRLPRDAATARLASRLDYGR